jgi:hypothetical protein
MADLRGGSTVGSYPIPGKLGTDNKLARFKGNLLIDSLITDDGTNLGLPATTTIGTITPTQISYLGGARSNIQAQIDAMGTANSPAFTGTPTAPTAAVNTNTTQIATTAFVLGQVATVNPSMDGVVAVGISNKYAREDHVHPIDTSRAPLASPGLTGVPTSPTAVLNTNTTQIATTAFVLGQVATANPLMDGPVAVGISTKFAREDHVHPTDTSRAPLASPVLTGIPLSPTAAIDTNTTQIATTAFVVGQASVVNPLMDGAVAVGIATRFSREDHIHPTDTSRAPLASPALSGTPSAPTAAVNTNTTQIATTAFVLGQAGTANPLMDGAVAVGTSLLYARQDHIHATDTSRAPLASPGLTGVPTAPTAAVNTNTTQLATTAFVLAQAGAANPIMDGIATVGIGTRFSREDHIHPTDTSRAPLNSVATFTSRIEASSLGFNESASYIPHPNGASFATATASLTGYIKITLPVSWTNTMMMFSIDIFNYATGTSFTIVVTGYNYSTTPGWNSCTAYLIGPNGTLSYNVRFGHDGIKCAIYIGETGTTWSYPQINVRDFLGGFGTYDLTSWAAGWAAGVTTTLGTITQTITVNSPAQVNLANTFSAVNTFTNKLTTNSGNGRFVLPVGTDKWAT